MRRRSSNPLQTQLFDVPPARVVVSDRIQCHPRSPEALAPAPAPATEGRNLCDPSKQIAQVASEASPPARLAAADLTALFAFLRELDDDGRAAGPNPAPRAPSRPPGTGGSRSSDARERPASKIRPGENLGSGHLDPAGERV